MRTPRMFRSTRTVTAARRPKRTGLLLGGAVAGLAALALSACAGPAVGAASTPKASASSIDWSAVTPAKSITFWSNHPGKSQDTEQAAIDAFTAKTGISVNLVTAGASYDEVAQRFQAASQTKDVPDVVIASDVWWFRYHLNNQIIPVDDILKAVGSDTSDYVPALYGDYEYDGQHWAVPFARSTPLFYYNKDMWAAAGLPDKGPSSWAQLADWSSKLKGQVPSNGAAMGLSTGPSWGAWWLENFVWGQGGQYSDKFDLAPLTNDATVAGVQQLKDLVSSGTIAISKDSVADFTAGAVASTIGSTGSLAGVLKSAKFSVGTAYLPDGPKGSGTPTGGTGVAIAAASDKPHQLAAAMFVDFLTNTANTATFSQATGYMPVRTSAVESDTMKAVYAKTPQFRTAVDQLADKARSQDDVRVFVPGADAILNSALEQVLLQNADPKAALQQITPQLQTAYNENVEPYL